MGFRRSHKVIRGKSPAELDAMQAAGEIVGKALQAVKAAAKPGVSTLDLDAVAEATIRDAGAFPTFKGYGGFPGSICSSVNDMIVHGIPDEKTVLKDGDLVSIDCGATLDGWVGDSAWTFGIGEIAEDVRKLTAVCSVCGRDAAYHQRIRTGDEDGLEIGAGAVGGTESYRARCLLHHERH